MDTRTRLAAAAVAVALVVTATVMGPAAPARAATPTAVAVTGDTAGWQLEAGFRLDLTVRPWALFGVPLGIGTVTGSWKSNGYKSWSDMSCLFGLAWGMSTSTTTPHSVSFTCLWVGPRYLNNQPYLPVFEVVAVTVVDGPGGTLDIAGGGPEPSSTVNPITVAYY